MYFRTVSECLKHHDGEIIREGIYRILAEKTEKDLNFIPILKKIAEKDIHYWWDDNGSGGSPREYSDSLKSIAEEAILLIQKNNEL